MRLDGPPRRRSERGRRGLLLLVLGVATLAGLVLTAAPASADEDAERALAEKYAPMMRPVEQPKPCGPGEPYRPSDVGPIFGNDEVALRGPWQSHDLIEVAPTEKDIASPLFGYALDFPGNPLKPGCDFEEWFDRTWAGSPETVYAHVATQAGHPGRLALQYWFYYPFNDFNNKHESDWERIQVEFDAADATEALSTSPTRVVYSQHEGSEEAAWGADKLVLDAGTHPVVYVSAGSHSSHFESALFLLRSTTQGLGCDSTLHPGPAVAPVVRTIPSDRAAAKREFPWIVYQGAWGQRESRSFYDGATGPRAHDQWTQPFTWSQDAGQRSYAVPGGEVYGVKTTDFFCGVMEQGSMALLSFTANPLPVLVILVAVVGAVIWLVRRASWESARAFPLALRRSFAHTVTSAWRVYRARPRVFLVIGLVVAAVAVVTGVTTQLLTQAPVLADTSPQPHGWAAVAAATVLVALTAVVSNAAAVQALADLGSHDPVTVRGAYRAALRRGPLLVGTAVVYLVAVAIPLLTIWLAPLAVAIIVLSGVVFPVVQLEGSWGVRALARSWRLVRHQWFKVLLLIVFAALLAALLGGLPGSAVVLAAQVPFVIVNLIPGVVFALLDPFFSLVMAYAYYHGLADEQAAAADGDAAPRDDEPALV